MPDHQLPIASEFSLFNPDETGVNLIGPYGPWAAQHEHIMAKSLFSAGTTWPGVFLAEDLKALDILCLRDDVDSSRIGCAGFMTTWKDFILNKSFTHTWMTYVPILPKELDFPEILGLRVPLPTLVLNDNEDGLYTIGEMKKADAILREIFVKAGAASNYHCSFHPGPHKFDIAMQHEAFDWFDRWLK